MGVTFRPSMISKSEAIAGHMKTEKIWRNSNNGRNEKMEGIVIARKLEIKNDA